MRILILDLLAERIEFGHGGNIEMIKPFTDSNSEIEVFLVTPQYEIYTQFERLELKQIKKENVPNWDDDVEFKSEFSDLIDGTLVKFIRIFTPVGKVEDISKWVDENNFSCVFCSGSRRNVSQPEQWMINAKNLLMGTILAKKPLLGICFGHQLLAETLGGNVTRSPKRTDAVYNLNLTNLGSKDPLFDGLSNNGEGPITLYTHQDHVVNISTDQKIIIELLGSSKHCKNAAIRARIDDELLPVWGVQFHPEASKARINRSYDLGHITLEEKESFNREHDGAQVLENFSKIVHLKS
tara:strand:- start:9668 stop:10555 length:888 start_codon:yes stop_codon:yes gene_type:complete